MKDDNLQFQMVKKLDEVTMLLKRLTIIKLYENGASKAQAAKVVGVRPETVTKWLKGVKKAQQ